MYKSMFYMSIYAKKRLSQIFFQKILFKIHIFSAVNPLGKNEKKNFFKFEIW